MKTIVETTQLEFDKSNFSINLIEHDCGKLYVEIAQTIINRSDKAARIKINPSVLSDVIKVLQNYHAKLPKENKLNTKHITEIEQEKIQKYYLKGVSIKDLSMQTDQSPELIEMILRNNGIEIAENTVPKPRFWRKNKN
ncbi:hypothetical protein [Frigoriflavimonas asaccharolytica]|uniref:Uncharacterized protein n=1 Tax=Frigoriflavimonas asaccharolytica TaxID=2735899 RepID=A0A8J8G619_9FLAO|nr:hypothetical protein [Frigoriflavimonas asaccharolytica]NRS92158.1 hypothetical protein [Frigoriflavimonas asaccharolytica]